MQIQYHIGDVTVFESDKDYLEKRLKRINKYLAKHNDTRIHISIEKDHHHHKGNIFEFSAHLSEPGFQAHTQLRADTLKHGADQITHKLAAQLQHRH